MAPRTPVADAEIRLRELISRQNLKAQDQLPTERALAAQLGCSRETVRRALRRLELDGLIWRHHGKGTFIGLAPVSVDRPVDRVIETASAEDLINARLVYEPALAAAAAKVATRDDVEKLQKLAIATGAAKDWREYERLDDAFHKAVARASGNPLLAAIFVTLASVRGRVPWQRRHDDIFRKARKTEYATRQSAMHLAVVKAIAAGDSEAAHSSMRQHLEMIRMLLGAPSEIEPRQR